MSSVCVCVCVCACVRACVRACGRAGVRACVCATIVTLSANSSSRMQSSRIAVLAFRLTNWNNFPSGLVRMKTPGLRCSDTTDSNLPERE